MASPEFQQVLEYFSGAFADQENGPPPSIQDIRVAMKGRPKPAPNPDNVEYSNATIGGVPCRIVRPYDLSMGSRFMFLHGGGYVIGIDMHDGLLGHLALSAGAEVVAPDYRLAPENPYPAALNDAVLTYEGLLAQGVVSTDIAIGGDSSGGGLTLALLMRLRDEGKPLPSCGVLLSPWTDLTCSGVSYQSKADIDPIVQKEMLLAWGAMYLSGSDPKTVGASPLFGDYTGLPPLLFQAGDHETMLDDSREAAARAEAVGVETILDVWPEMIHGWQIFVPILPEAVGAVDRIGEFVRSKLL